MDWFIFIVTLISVFVGYSVGYARGSKFGWYLAQTEGILDYPLINVSMEHIRDDIYRFYYMLDGSFIIQGTVAEASAEILGEVDEGDLRKIIFAKVQTHEQPL